MFGTSLGGLDITISDNLPPDFYELNMPEKPIGILAKFWQRLTWKRIIKRRRESATPVTTKVVVMGNKIIMTNRQHRMLKAI